MRSVEDQLDNAKQGKKVHSESECDEDSDGGYLIYSPPTMEQPMPKGPEREKENVDLVEFPSSEDTTEPQKKKRKFVNW